MGVFEVSSTINLNFGLLRQLDSNSQKALEMTTDALLTEVKNAEVMPRYDGTLQNESTFPDYSNSDKGVTSIVSSTPYARRLYFHPEYNFHQEEWTDIKGRKHGGNANAGGKWFEPWLKDGTRQNFCSEAFATIYRRLCGL